ncbi:type IV pilin protein [Aquabacterium humicola]|uniref:type IV pilin protein n=1 Tax=Aquabacterium humicola TaxID=3237377 RepID=UPI002543E15A|nr:type IV pilin protein [Rubrivivax pictus]
MRAMRQSIPPRLCRQGFTLIELLITIAIIGILASIAYPNFMGSVRKGRRADAVEGMTRLQQAQERWRGRNAAYTTSFADLGLPSGNVSPNGYYTYTLAVGAGADAGSQYTITAQAQGSQVSDTACKYLRVAMVGGNMTYSSSADGSAWNSAGVNACWAK